MEYRILGRSGLKVSAIAMGTFTFGGVGPFGRVGNQGVDEARRLVDLCLDHGVNTFDCANMYSMGLAEEILGEVLEGEALDQALADLRSFDLYAPEAGSALTHRIAEQIIAKGHYPIEYL